MNALVVLVVLLALLGGALVGLLVARSGRGPVPDQAVVDSAVRDALAAAGRERDATVQSALDTLVTVAADKLGAQSSSHTRELDLRSAAFEERVRDMGAKLEAMTRTVVELRRERAEQQGQLEARLEAAATSNRLLTETTQHLREALASPRARGQWGERMAEDVLERAGFVEGVNYRRQSATAGGTVPDFTFLMPRGIELNMDVKFPVDNYLRWLEAAEDQKPTLAKAFVRDARARVRELTGRGYIDPERTVDQLLLFIPNESVYAFLHEQDPHVVDEALAHRIVLCSPFTLFSVLAVVRQAVDNFRLERTSSEILSCLGTFQTQWDKFAEHLDKVHRQFQTVQKSFDELGGTRRRQLERQLDRIEALRADRRAVVPLDQPQGRTSPPAAGDVRSLRDVASA